jgi:hypothetical protein
MENEDTQIGAMLFRAERNRPVIPLRDYFASIVVQEYMRQRNVLNGLDKLASSAKQKDGEIQQLAASAYAIADAMLLERNKGECPAHGGK